MWTPIRLRTARASRCGSSSAPTARCSSPSPATAASCTARGRTRRSGPTSSTSSTRARGATTSPACSPARSRPSARSPASSRCPRSSAGRSSRAYLGYYAHQRYAGQGMMREAMEQLLDHTFGPLGAAPARGQHPARQPAVDRARARRRLPARGLLAALPADRRPVARPRALRDHRRRARGSEEPELSRLGLALDLEDDLRLLDDRLRARARAPAARAGRAPAARGGGGSRSAASSSIDGV